MFMIASTTKLVAQVLFIAAGIICLKMGERTIADALIFSAIGSLVPIAEKRDVVISSLHAGDSRHATDNSQEDGK